MKRIFTLLVAVAALCSVATARNLWTGSYYPTKSASSECPKIEGSAFAGLNVSTQPELVFTIDGDENGAWRTFELWADGIKDNGGADCIVTTGYFVPGVQKIVIPITEELLVKLQKHGCWPGGNGYTVTSIDLEGTEPFDGLIWEGEQNITWTAFEIPGSKFDKVKGGYTLCIDLVPVDADLWTGLNVMISGAYAPFAPVQETGLAARPTLKYALSDGDVEKLKANGLGFAGANVKITKVYVTGNDISTAVTPIMDEAVDKGVYSLSGVKVASSMESANELAPGVYVCGGKKFVVR